MAEDAQLLWAVVGTHVSVFGIGLGEFFFPSIGVPLFVVGGLITAVALTDF